MKTTRITLLLTMLLIGILATSGKAEVKDIKPSKNYITRNYKVAGFDKLDISTVADVYYTQSTDGTTSVEIYGPDNIVELIQLSIKNKTLTIFLEKKNRVKNIKKMKVTISSPNLYALSFKGVGDVNIAKGIKTTTLDLSNHGVGNIVVDGVECETLKVVSSGVGNIKLLGETQSVTLTSDGVGNINASELKSVHVVASAQGVGNISCYATESISAKAGGIGNITYKGNPSEKKIHKSGIGSIKQKQ